MKKYKIPCKYCGEIVERERKQPTASCFPCKDNNKKDYARIWYTKRWIATRNWLEMPPIAPYAALKRLVTPTRKSQIGYVQTQNAQGITFAGAVLK